MLTKRQEKPSRSKGKVAFLDESLGNVDTKAT